MNNRGIARVLVEWYLLREALEYQHRERVRVGIRRRVHVVVFNELGCRIPDDLSGHSL